MNKNSMFPILHENAHWLAVNKPAGLMVERGTVGFPSVEETVWNYCAKSVKKPYVGIIHRLDRPTSGVIILAKKKQALKQFNEQFRLRKIRKSYLAILEKAPPQSSGKLRHWLKKDTNKKKAIIFQQPENGAQECILTYRFLKQVGENYLVEVVPKTGKYHQIRAQFAAIGCPILGDLKYGAEKTFAENAIALHAWKLRGIDPVTSENFELEADWQLLKAVRYNSSKGFC